MNTRLENFLELSVYLTGFDRIPLLSTAMLEVYLEQLVTIVPIDLLDRLLALVAELPIDPTQRNTAVETHILQDQDLGPVARNIIVMWYCGSWAKLPDDWSAIHGRAALDYNRVISAAAYLTGLQWSVVGAHPAGGQPQGFAAWALPAVI